MKPEITEITCYIMLLVLISTVILGKHKRLVGMRHLWLQPHQPAQPLAVLHRIWHITASFGPRLRSIQKRFQQVLQ